MVRILQKIGGRICIDNILILSIIIFPLLTKNCIQYKNYPPYRIPRIIGLRWIRKCLQTWWKSKPRSARPAWRLQGHRSQIWCHLPRLWGILLRWWSHMFLQLRYVVLPWNQQPRRWLLPRFLQCFFKRHRQHWYHRWSWRFLWGIWTGKTYYPFTSSTSFEKEGPGWILNLLGPARPTPSQTHTYATMH